jgi:hypothetical protein
MCEDSKNKRLLVFTSVTERSAGKKHCDLNNGQQHHHVIKVENRRHEIVLVQGHVRTFHCLGQVEFLKNGGRAATWDPNFQALGQMTSEDRAEAVVNTGYSQTEDIIADLQYSFDDPFSGQPDIVKLTIRVNL